MIRVVKRFFDLQDECFEYNVGDVYPRKGHKVSDARIAELASEKNKLGVSVIEVVETKEETPKKTKKSEKA